MKFTGKVWKFRDDVNTDEIIPARYMNTSDPKELAKHTMEDIDKDVMKKMTPGDIIVGGKNFGCGSSREHAPICLKEAKVACVIAKSFARIFYRNSFNMGFSIIESVEAAEDIKEGDTIEIDLAAGEIRNKTTGKVYKVAPYPKFMQELINAGGLMNYVKKNA